MSCSGFSKLVYGVRINFTTEKYEQTFQRFDSKTGEPIELKSPAYRLKAHHINGKTIAELPEDTLCLKEDCRGKYSHEEEDWFYYRNLNRIKSWFLSIGIPFNDEIINQYGFFSGPRKEEEYRPLCKIVGIIIASGSSYSTPAIKVNQDIIDSARVACQEKLDANDLSDWKQFANLELHTSIS